MKIAKKGLFLGIMVSVGLFSSASFAAPVNVNTASPEVIASSLHGIGAKKAAAISEYCHKHECHKPADLLHVKGVGEKSLAKFSADLRFADKEDHKHAH